MKRQPVGDVDDAGKFQRSWLWECCECGEKEIHVVGKLPPGWDLVEEEGDLETGDAVCPDCVDEGYGRECEDGDDEELPGLEITGDDDGNQDFRSPSRR
mgnify:CR=1 FL=1